MLLTQLTSSDDVWMVSRSEGSLTDCVVGWEPPQGLTGGLPPHHSEVSEGLQTHWLQLWNSVQKATDNMTIGVMSVWIRQLSTIFLSTVSHSFSAYFPEVSRYTLISGSWLVSWSTENELATVLITETFLDLERNMGIKDFITDLD